MAQIEHLIRGHVPLNFFSSEIVPLLCRSGPSGFRWQPPLFSEYSGLMTPALRNKDYNSQVETAIFPGLRWRTGYGGRSEGIKEGQGRPAQEGRSAQIREIMGFTQRRQGAKQRREYIEKQGGYASKLLYLVVQASKAGALHKIGFPS